MPKKLDNAKSRSLSRREALGISGATITALAAGLGAATSAAGVTAHGEVRWSRLRRVVTSDDANGHGVLLHDGEPTNVSIVNGTRITRLWEASEVPVSLPLNVDAGATAGNAYRTGFRGSSFYIAELPGGAEAPAIKMHRTSTLDFMAILSGRIIYRIEGRDLELRAGDTLVQGGNLHTWINRWPEPCVLLFVVLTGVHSKP